MYFLSSSSAQSVRAAQLDNLHRFSQIFIDAAEKFFALSTSLGEVILNDGSQSSYIGLSQNPLTGFESSQQLWLELSKHHLPSFFTSYIHIASQAHEEMLKVAEEQIRASQQLLTNSLDKARSAAPWEAELLLQAMHSSVDLSSNALAQASEAGIKTTELVDQQVSKVIKPPRKTEKNPA